MSDDPLDAKAEVAQPPRSIGSQVASGAAYVAMAQAVKVVVTLLSTIVVARLLAPEQYGVVAMTAPFASFLQVFQSLGLNQAMVQRPVISHEQYNAMFWLNLAASALIALGLLVIAPLVAAFYHEPRAGWLTAATAATVFLTGCTLQHAALLNRRLRFAALSAIDAATYLATFVGTAVTAFLLHSFWAIWWGAFLGAATNVALLWIADRWRPGLRSDFRGVREMLNFGANVTGFNVLNSIGRNLDNVLIAKAWGGGAVGLYDRAYKLLMFPLQNLVNPLGKLMIPTLSRMSHQPERYRAYFLHATRGLTTLIAPAIVVAIAAPEPLVEMLLGRRWISAGPIFFWLSVAGLAQLLTQTTSWAFISLGRGRDYLRWGLVSSLSSAAAFAAGLTWGAAGVAAAYALSEYAVRAPYAFWSAGRGAPVAARDYAALLAPSLGLAALVWISGRVLAERLTGLPLLAGLTAESYTLALALLLATRDGRASARLAGRLAARLPWRRAPV